MSESKSLDEWMNDWQALQRQYLNAWSDFAAKAPNVAAQGAAPSGQAPFGSTPFGAPPFGAMPGAAFGASPPWHEGLEQWARLFGDPAKLGNAGKQSETAERVLASAKSYLAMIQSMFGALAAQNGVAGSAGIDPSANPAQAWFESLRGGFGASSGLNIPGMDAAVANNPAFLNNPFAKAVRDIAGQGAKGFTELPAAFAPFIEQMRQEGLSWLRMPAFGVGREHQEHYQKTALAFVEYQQALHNYSLLMLKANQRGFELFENKLADRSEPGRTIDSLRALYDLWVDAAEEAYAEIALSDEFAKVYGELANAQMRARSQVQAEVERVSTDLGMPTRSELNSLHKRVHDLRREVRDGREEQPGSGSAFDSSELEAQIADLRKEVAALKAALARAPQPARPPVTAATGAKPPSVEARKTKAKARSKSVAPVPATRTSRAGGRVRHIALVPPVVRPRPAPAKSDNGEAPRTSFGDAIAAMRRRVVSKSKSAKSSKLKAVAAGMSKPSKQNKSERAGKKKSGKRKK